MLWYNEQRKVAILALRPTFTTQNRILDLQFWHKQIRGYPDERAKSKYSSLCYQQIHSAVAAMESEQDKNNVLCHAGFYKTLGSCVTQRPLSFLKDRKISDGLSQLWVTGMSLGGGHGRPGRSLRRQTLPCNTSPDRELGGANVWEQCLQ